MSVQVHLIIGLKSSKNYSNDIKHISGYNGIELEINNREIERKLQNIRRLDNIHLKTQE